MSSLKRKIKRKQAKKKLKESNEKMTETLGLFGKLPDHCLACKVPYNRKSKEAALRWRVSVNAEEETLEHLAEESDESFERTVRLEPH